MVIGQGFAAPAHAEDWDQVGAYPPSTSLVATTRMYMNQPGSRLHSTTIGRFYWIGVVFPNGYFYQAGYMDMAWNCTGFETFTTRLAPNGNFVDPTAPYGTTHCGLTGSHWFKLAVASTTESTITWQFYMDGDPIGPTLAFPNTVQNEHFVRNQIATVSENSTTGTLPNDPAFPTTRYPHAIQFNLNGSWSDASNGDYTARDNNCRLRALQLNAGNDLTTGRTADLSNPGCYHPFDPVW